MKTLIVTMMAMFIYNNCFAEETQWNQYSNDYNNVQTVVVEQPHREHRLPDMYVTNSDENGSFTVKY